MRHELVASLNRLTAAFSRRLQGESEETGPGPPFVAAGMPVRLCPQVPSLCESLVSKLKARDFCENALQPKVKKLRNSMHEGMSWHKLVSSSRSKLKQRNWYTEAVAQFSRCWQGASKETVPGPPFVAVWHASTICFSCPASSKLPPSSQLPRIDKIVPARQQPSHQLPTPRPGR